MTYFGPCVKILIIMHKRNSVYKQNGYTLVEIIMAICVMGILFAMTVIGYNGWRHSVIVVQVKSDLNTVASAMESYRNLGKNGYPADISILPDFVNSKGVLLSGGSNDGGKTYCVNGASSEDNTVHYHIMSNVSPQDGVCGPLNLVAVSVGTNDVELSWDEVAGAESYSVQRASDSAFTSSMSQSNFSSETATINGLTPNSKYFFRVQAVIGEVGGGWSNVVEATTSSVTQPTSTPTVTASYSEPNVIASASSVICTVGTTQYSFDYKIHNGSVQGDWVGYSTWSSTPSFSQVANQGYKYDYRARARCYVNDLAFSGEVTGSDIQYTHPISAPASPTVTASTVGNTTTWSWPSVTCAVGNVNYQYRYTIQPAGSDSGWVNHGTNTSQGFTTATQGQTYKLDVQARCTNTNDTTGTWSGSGSVSYYNEAPAASVASAVGGSGSDSSRSIAQTSDGGYVVTGSTSSFGAGSADMFIAKYTHGGTLSWTKTWGGSGYDWGTSVIQSSDGGYVVVGHTRSFTPAYDAIIVKYSSNGTMLWNKTWGTSGYEIASDVMESSDGGYIMTGYTDSYGVRNQDGFVAKFSSAGSVLWSRTFAKNSTCTMCSDQGNSIKPTSDGGFVVAGHLQNNSGTSGSTVSIFISKFTSAGAISWTRQIGASPSYGTVSSYGLGLAVASDGFIVTGESFYGGSDQFCIVKFNTSGAFSWMREINSSGYGWAMSATQANDGSYITSGKINGYGSGSGDVITAKFSPAGALSWAKTWGGTGDDGGVGMVKTTDGGFAISGSTGSYGSGSLDSILLKFNSSGNIANCPASICRTLSISPRVVSETVVSLTLVTTTPSVTAGTPSAVQTSPTFIPTVIVGAQ